MAENELLSGKSWLSYLDFTLEPQKLHNHLSKKDAVPTACQLIKNFMEKMLVVGCEVIEEADGSDAIRVTDTANLEDVLWKVLEVEKISNIKLMCVQAAAHLNWDLAVIEEGLPLPIQFSLMLCLLQQVGTKQRNIAQVNLDDLAARNEWFALLLYHRWRMRMFVEHSCPRKPSKGTALTIPLPSSMSLQIDNTPIWYTQSTANQVFTYDAVLTFVKDELSCSKSYMDKMLSSCQLDSEYPVPYCRTISATSALQQTMECKHINRYISTEEALAQLCYEFGKVMFMEDRYSSAERMFEAAILWASAMCDGGAAAAGSAKQSGYVEMVRSELVGYLHQQQQQDGAVVPPEPVVELCAAFLVNSGPTEWGYWADVASTVASQHLRFAAILVRACQSNEVKDVTAAMNQAKPLWDTLVLMFQHESQEHLLSSATNPYGGNGGESTRDLLPEPYKSHLPVVSLVTYYIQERDIDLGRGIVNCIVKAIF